MPIIDSKTGKTRKKYSVDELIQAANYMRGINMVSLCAAGSGHAGGTMSIMDVAAALYLHSAVHDPQDPFWDGRDRIIWSTGHKAPSLYISLGMAGYYDVEDVVKLRKLYAPYQGHPHWVKLPGVEASTGSLGQGLSIAVGIALAARLDKKDYQVYVLTGDGEHQEGQMWEAIMEAGHYKLDNLTNVIDKNRLQIDGWVKDVMDIDPIVDKYQAFNWNVMEIDGHNMKEVLDALEKARNFKGKPTVIVANTIKGKGVDFMENVAGWHGKSPICEQMESALEQLGFKDKKDVLDQDKLFAKADKYQAEATEKLEAKQPRFSRDYFWNKSDRMKVKMDATRKGFGRALNEE